MRRYPVSADRRDSLITKPCGVLATHRSGTRHVDRQTRPQPAAGRFFYDPPAMVRARTKAQSRVAELLFIVQLLRSYLTPEQNRRGPFYYFVPVLIVKLCLGFRSVLKV